MIEIIGIKRIVILASLIAINVILFLVQATYIDPSVKQLNLELGGINSAISTLQTDIGNIKVEFEQLDQQQAEFDALKEVGFFSEQLRNVAKESLNNVQTQSEVISAIVTIGAGVPEENEQALKAKHVILNSPVEITLKAFDDRSIYRYMYLLNFALPGHLSFDQVKIRRVLDVTPTVLRAIAGGENPELVEATLEMSWQTLIPADQVLDRVGGQ